MKSLKSKLMAAGAMLMISAVMLTSASFAWFTVSTAPEIADIDVTMTATKNLEIAKATNMTTEPEEVTVNDGTDETKWGSTVSSFTGTVNFPAAVDGGALKTVSYGADGRTTGLTVTADAPSNLSSGVGYYTATPSTAAGSKNVAAAFGVWLRSNQDLTDVIGTITVPENSKFKVAFDVGGTLYDSGANFSLTANEATLVIVVVYADGDSVVASDVASDLKVENIKVEFSSATIG